MFQLMNDACGYFSESRQRTTALSAPLLFAWGTDPEVGEAMNVSLASNEAVSNLVDVSSGLILLFRVTALEIWCMRVPELHKRWNWLRNTAERHRTRSKYCQKVMRRLHLACLPSGWGSGHGT